jgi:flagellar motor switch protein FliN/FliY
MSEARPGTPAQGMLEHTLDQAAEAVAVGTRRLEELADKSAGKPELSLQQLSGVPIPVTVQLGRVRLTLGDLCRLESGVLLELDREAHEPADILVNGKVVAHGEIVTVDGHYGVRITSVEP